LVLMRLGAPLTDNERTDCNVPFMKAVALELKAHGAKDDDRIDADWHGCTFSPVTVAAMVRAYAPPSGTNTRLTSPETSTNPFGS
jgi:hypothetical protein